MVGAPSHDDLFDRARESDLEAVAGVRLWRAGRRMRGPCPVCGASARKKADGAFWIDPEIGRFGCFAGGADCAAGGDVVRLEQLLRGGTAREAAERLAGPSPNFTTRNAARVKPAAAARQDEASPADITAARLWRESVPASGTLVETYLRARWLSGPVLDRALRRLRFHPSALWGRNEAGDWIRAPAMVAAVHTPAGPTGGVHVTYLRPDGTGKARLDPAKRMWGPQKDEAGRAGGCWLIGPKGAGPVIVGEGIESSLSAAVLFGQPCRVAAALALNRLQGGWLPDKYGRLNPEAVAIDPERPAFVWALEEGAGVMIAVDRDMKPVEIKVRKALGGTMRRTLSGDDRARICAGLAEAAWRAANPGLAPGAIRSIGPGPGRDFNEELRERRV